MPGEGPPASQPPRNRPPPGNRPPRNSSPTPDQLLAVTGGKGGCGKTTTTLGIAAASTRAGTTTLAVDADVDMPNLHLLAGVDRTPTLGADRPVEIAHESTVVPGLEIAPAPSGVARVPAADLARCRQNYQRVLIDCPAGAGTTAAAPLRAADAALGVTTLEPQCLEDALRTAEMARALDTPIAGVVVSRAESIPNRLATVFDAPFLASVPAVDDPLGAPATTTAYRSVHAELAGDDTAETPAKREQRSPHCHGRSI